MPARCEMLNRINKEYFMFEKTEEYLKLVEEKMKARAERNAKLKQAEKEAAEQAEKAEKEAKEKAEQEKRKRLEQEQRKIAITAPTVIQATKHIIPLPSRLGLSQSIEFIRSFSFFPNVDSYVFDFASLSWVEPFGLLYFSNEIRRFAQKIQPASVVFQNVDFSNDSHSYAAHMGFFEACGKKIGNRPGEARGSNTYLPITQVEVQALKNEARSLMKEVGKIVEGHSAKLAKVLTQQNQGDLVDTLTYSIREIIRNVVEHSESSTFEYCAQYLPAKDAVEVCILDTGIGIKQSLLTNPDIEVQNDREALNMCLMPGVSSKIRRGRKMGAQDDVWSNAGVGLYMTSRLCSNSGSFFICSGESGLLLTTANKQHFDTNFSGTALRLVVIPSRNHSLSQSLTKISKDGRELEKLFTGKDRPNARAASRMLYRDFQINEAEDDTEYPF